MNLHFDPRDIIFRGFVTNLQYVCYTRYAFTNIKYVI